MRRIRTTRWRTGTPEPWAPVGLARTLVIAVLCVACDAGGPRPPDLLLVTADAIRADRLACYGGPADLGVAICGLGDPGLRFVWAIAPASSGGPSAASLLTSLYPSEHGLDAHPESFLRSEAVTAAERLAGGYRTAAVVSSPELTASRNLDQGFEWFDQRLERRRGEPPTRDATATTEAAIAWLDDREGPWFLWVHYGDLHGPFPPPAIPNYEVYEERYRGRLRRLDAELGRLLDAVEARGEPVEVVFAGLHGEAIGEDGRWFVHGHSLGLEQIRVPLLWRPASLRSAGVVTTPVSLLDVLPTLLRAARREIPLELEGVPLPLPDEPPVAPGVPRAIFAEHPEQRVVVSGRFFYLRGRVAGLGARLAELPDDGVIPPLAPARGATARARIELLERRLEEFETGTLGPASPTPEDGGADGLP